MSIYGNSQIKMSSCFIVVYLNVKVIRNLRDADTSYLYGLYHIHSQLHSSLAPPQLPEVHTTLLLMIVGLPQV